MRTKVYILLDPEGEIRYVGKTVGTLGGRLSGHIGSAQREEKGHKCNWIRALLQNYSLPTIQLLEVVDGNGSREEITWIAYCKAEGMRLTNQTAGGDGGRLPGFKHSEETKKKISRKGKGHHCSEETRKKMSGAKKGLPPPNKGIPQSEENRRKNSDSHKGQLAWNKGIPRSKKTKRKMSLSCIGKRHLEETKKKIGRGVKKALASRRQKQ